MHNSKQCPVVITPHSIKNLSEMLVMCFNYFCSGEGQQNVEFEDRPTFSVSFRRERRIGPIVVEE